MRADVIISQAVTTFIVLVISFVMMLNVRAETDNSLPESASNPISRPAATTNCALATVELALRRLGVNPPSQSDLDIIARKDAISVEEVRIVLEQCGLTVDAFATSAHPSFPLRQYVERLGTDGSLAIALLPDIERHGVGHYILLDRYNSGKLAGVDPQNGMPFMVDWNGICNDEVCVVLMFVSHKSRNWLFRPMSQVELLISGALTAIVVTFTSLYVGLPRLRNFIAKR